VDVGRHTEYASLDPQRTPGAGDVSRAPMLGAPSRMDRYVGAAAHPPLELLHASASNSSLTPARSGRVYCMLRSALPVTADYHCTTCV
jgi:hypothetical protein